MIEIQPRVIRVSNAPAYLAMSLPYFNEKVRPYLVEVIDSSRMKCFDRLDLDAWWEQHKQAKGMPAKEKQSWQKEPQVLERKAKSGTLKKLSPVSSFDAALEKRNLTKLSVI